MTQASQKMKYLNKVRMKNHGLKEASKKDDFN